MPPAVQYDATDPLSRFLLPPPGETPEDRAARLQAEALAVQKSREIDDEIKKQAKDKKEFVKVLLLGQAESGKSTTLKNMKLVYAKDSFRAERGSWVPIVHFNILRQMVSVVRLVEEAIGLQEAEEASRQRESSESRLDPERQSVEARGRLQFTNDHRVLCMRLRPLLDLESTFTAHLNPYLSPALDSQRSTLGRREVFVQSHFAWIKHFQPGGSVGVGANAGQQNHHRTSKGDALRNELARVLNALAKTILALWTDQVVRRLLNCRGVRLELEAGFFLDDVERVTALNYEPTDLDVCKARLKTVGVSETHLVVSSLFQRKYWVVYDVGGSRTQRATWKPYFEDVNAIVFLAPLSAFNQQLEEDPEINRLADSLMLWKDISGSPLLVNAHLILFLNKIDLLQKKLEQGIEFGNYIHHYSGSNDLEAVCKYMKKRFLSVNKEAQSKIKLSSKSSVARLVRVFPTSVLDIEATSRIIVQVQDTILGSAIQSCDLV
ncbi:related to guanine nucleotide-binding protein alpha-4 subunit [Serendipita indica DSM 11827]|uniref:Related to guanine nucleotide-binding protein alpha-4 subunit n=1 Tax=Serendipita indica (strain DSM 11827) TaxID=1109443 RepID=G4TLH1_SERID|nr:related to guanine nucleotide-binding protein alpha-4 subunit [Serendipita indica DSM 11827]